MRHRLLICAFVAGGLLLASSCSSGNTPDSADKGSSNSSQSESDTETSSGSSVEFKAEVWADNWFALYVNGALVGEDSVPITTERSFNAETITFSASYPLTVAMITKDFKESDSGLEYIGTDRQQMGDGGFIAQITDVAFGDVVAVTGTEWRGLVIHRAPTNKDCESFADPDADCQFEITEEPSGWTDASFDDSAWIEASTYSTAEVGTKEGYDTIAWDASASLIWGTDLQADNTILWRYGVASP